jgi:hypothetical protein
MNAWNADSRVLESRGAIGEPPPHIGGPPVTQGTVQKPTTPACSLWTLRRDARVRRSIYFGLRRAARPVGWPPLAQKSPWPSRSRRAFEIAGSLERMGKAR